MLLRFKSFAIVIIALAFMVTMVACGKEEVIEPMEPNLIKLAFEAEKEEYLSGEEAKIFVDYDISDPSFEIKSFIINFQKVILEEEEGQYFINMKTSLNETKFTVTNVEVTNGEKTYTIRVFEAEFEINVTNNETKIDVGIVQTKINEVVREKNEYVIYDNEEFFKLFDEFEVIIKVQNSSGIQYDRVEYAIKNNLVNYYEGVVELEWIGTDYDSGYPINEYRFMLESNNFSEENNEFEIKTLLSEGLGVADRLEQNNGFSYEFKLKEEELSKEFRFNLVKSDSEYIILADNRILNQRKTLISPANKEMNGLVMELIIDNMPYNHLNNVEVTVIKDKKTEKIEILKKDLSHTNRNGADVVTFILKDDFSDGSDYKITSVSLGIVDESFERKIINPDKRFTEYTVERWDLLIRTGKDFEKLYLSQDVKKVLLLNNIEIRGEMNTNKENYIKDFNGTFEGNGYSIFDRGNVSLFGNIGKNAIIRNFLYNSLEFIPDYSASDSDERNSLYKTAFAVNNEGLIENIITEIHVRTRSGNRTKNVNGFVQNNGGTIKNVEIRNTYKLSMHLNEINLVAEYNSGTVENIVLNHTGLGSTIETTYRRTNENDKFNVYVIKEMEDVKSTKVENIIINMNLHAERSAHVDNFHAITSTLASNTKVKTDKVFISSRMERDYKAGITTGVKDFYNTYPEDTLDYEYFVERTKLSTSSGFVFEISNEFGNEELLEGGNTMYQNNGVVFDPMKWNFKINAGLEGTFSLKFPEHKVW